MSLSARESRRLDLPGLGTLGCGTHVPPLHVCVNGATAMVVGPVKVVLAVVVQSVWNFHRPRVLAVVALGIFMKYAGEPAGGGLAPSRSGGHEAGHAGSLLETLSGLGRRTR